ncbi:MAG TPA: response regulator, partial [Salinimicrobium sp.]|nr:response regulator [Salinimicrobium sp.]
LVSRKYEVKSFARAGEFETYMEESQPDLILLDMMLPDGNGFEICDSLGTNPETNEIPIILMSAHTSTHLAKNKYASDFISKPFDIDELLVKIEKQLN